MQFINVQKEPKARYTTNSANEEQVCKNKIKTNVLLLLLLLLLFGNYYYYLRFYVAILKAAFYIQRIYTEGDRTISTVPGLTEANGKTSSLTGHRPTSTAVQGTRYMTSNTKQTVCMLF